MQRNLSSTPAGQQQLAAPGLADAVSLGGASAAVTAAVEREQTSPAASPHSQGAAVHSFPLGALRKACFDLIRDCFGLS